MRAPDRGLEDHLTREEEEFIKRYLARPESFPPEFWRAIMQKVALDGEPIPRSQVQGLSSFTARFDYVATLETTSSATFTDLATVGPTLTELSNGNYLVLHGCLSFTDAGEQAIQGVQVNSVAVSNDTTIIVGSTASDLTLSSSRAFLASLENANNNTLTVKYKSGSGAAIAFQYRWLIALKLGN